MELPVHRWYVRARASLVAQTVKDQPAMQEVWGLIPGSGRSPGEVNGSPLQYSCLENSMDRGGLQGIVHEVTELDMTERQTLYKKIIQKRIYIYIYE